MTIGERIKAVRKAKGLTQVQFADMIGIAGASLSLLESGRNNPSRQTIMAICSQFGISEEWISTGDGEMFEELDPDEELMRFVGTITKDDSHPLNRLARILAHLPPEGIELINQAVEYLLDREKDA